MTIDEIVREIDRRVQSIVVDDMEDLGFFLREHWAEMKHEMAAMCDVCDTARAFYGRHWFLEDGYGPEWRPFEAAVLRHSAIKNGTPKSSGINAWNPTEAERAQPSGAAAALSPLPEVQP